MSSERLVRFEPRAVLSTVAVLLSVAIGLYLLWVSRRIFSWVLIALFLALAINPLVDWLHRHLVPRRGLAVGIVFTAVLALVAGGAALVVPTVVDQVSQLADEAPNYVKDLTAGRGPLGFLETKYQVVERVQDAVKGGGGGGGSGLSSGAGVVVDAGKTVIAGVLATVTIVFMTLFLLLEGPGWLDRGFSLMDPESRPRWHQNAEEIYRTVGGYVSGNLLISVIAGVIYGVMLAVLGVPFPFALGFLVAILDLIPLAGATIAGAIVVLVSFTTGTTEGIVMAVFVVVYQLVENHVLQPIIYGRTVQLSPLVVLVSILIGSQVAGVLGALGAIPIAGSVQVLLIDHLEHRKAKREAQAAAALSAA